MLERELPALDRLDRVARAKDVEIRHRAQRGQMFDRLMRRAVLPESDRVMGHHVDHAFPRERAEADRGTAIIREHEERARIGNNAAVQRHAIHRRGHPVLTHAVMDKATGIIAGREDCHAFGPGIVGAGQVG